MSRLVIGVALLGAWMPSLLLAQTQVPDAFRGQWKASWSQREVKLALTEAGGTWNRVTYGAFASHDACSRYRTSVVVEAASAEELTLKVLASKAVNGCADETVVLKRAGDKGLTARMGDADVAFVKD